MKKLFDYLDRDEVVAWGIVIAGLIAFIGLVIFLAHHVYTYG